MSPRRMLPLPFSGEELGVNPMQQQPNLQPLIDQVQAWWTDEHANCRVQELWQPRPGLEGLWRQATMPEVLSDLPVPVCGWNCGWKNGRSRSTCSESPTEDQGICSRGVWHPSAARRGVGAAGGFSPRASAHWNGTDARY